MAEKPLEEALRVIVKRYGIDRATLALRKLERSNDECASRTEIVQSEESKRPRSPSRPSKRPKVTAPLYVAKLDISPEKCQPLMQLANKFDDKKFLPTLGEIRNFCIVYSIDAPSTSSRVAAIPRVFRFLSTLSADDIQAMLHSELFSGPSRLAPIADAIRRNSHARRGVDRTGRQETNSLSKDSTKPSTQKKP